MLYKRDLAYQADALVNWDPVDMTVLANEQVDSNGRSWRSGAVVEQKYLRQWFFRITAFQKPLLEDLDLLSRQNRWPARVLTQQRNWLGKSSGTRLRIDVEHPSGNISHHYVFTTRPDTIFGAKYLAVSLRHELSGKYKNEVSALQNLLDANSPPDSTSKVGVRLPVKARIPSVSEEFNLQVYSAPYVLDSYGEGAVMGVPAHDSRDLAFWKQNDPREEIPVVVHASGTQLTKLHIRPEELDGAITEPGTLTKLCGKFAGMESAKAAENIVHELSQSGEVDSRLAIKHDNWRLRDWLVSRQRYWGTPIPIVHCKTCGTVPVPEVDLPIELPRLEDSMKGQRGNPLDTMEDWANVPCPSCSQPARRETDTMDTFVDSSWYYARFIDPNNSNEPFSQSAAEAMLPVDTYVGGVEHAILHLLYARFIYKFLCSENRISQGTTNTEPFQQLIAQGMVHGKTFSNPTDGRFLKPDEIETVDGSTVIKKTGKFAGVSWEKMSKSKHNGVDPSTCIQKYGADATRAHILFAAPVSEVLQWDEEKIVGIQRWFTRVERILPSASQLKVEEFERMPTHECLAGMSPDNAALLLATHATVASVLQTFEKDLYSLNTVISDLIKLTNLIHETGKDVDPRVANIAVYALLRMIAPIAPAFAEECWEKMTTKTGTQFGSILFRPWPCDIISSQQENELRSSEVTMTCTVQINGKVKFTAKIPKLSTALAAEASEERTQKIVDAVLETEEGRLWLTEKNEWKKRRKVILVGGGKILSVVF